MAQNLGWINPVDQIGIPQEWQILRDNFILIDWQYMPFKTLYLFWRASYFKNHAHHVWENHSLARKIYWVCPSLRDYEEFCRAKNFLIASRTVYEAILHKDLMKAPKYFSDTLEKNIFIRFECTQIMRADGTFTRNDQQSSWIFSGLFALIFHFDDLRPVLQIHYPNHYSTNYMSVSLTKIGCKFIEHFVRHSVLAHLLRIIFFNSTRHGVIPNRLPLTNMLCAQNEISTLIDPRKTVGLVSLDLLWAFNIVKHRLLLTKRWARVISCILCQLFATNEPSPSKSGRWNLL